MDKFLAKGAYPAYPQTMGGKRTFTKTRYRGVYYRESTTRQVAGRPDRCFVVWVAADNGKGRWHTVGWVSEGITEKLALAKRQELIQENVLGRAQKKNARATVASAVDAYAAWAKAEGKAIDREISRYEKHMKKPLGALRIEMITGGMLTALKADLLTRLAPESVHHCFAFLRRAINHAISEGLHGGTNPLATGRRGTFTMPKVRNACERFLTPGEAKRLLDELRQRSPQLHDMSLLSLKTGLRSTEIFSIRGQDVKKGTGEIFITAKGGQRQCVHASPEIIDMLLAYDRMPGERIFQSSKGGPIKWGISDAFGRAVDRLGLNKGIDDKRNQVWFHTWRHTFASWLAQSGEVTLLELKELMRHERIETTERYAHLIPGHQIRKLTIIDETLRQG